MQNNFNNDLFISQNICLCLCGSFWERIFIPTTEAQWMISKIPHNKLTLHQNLLKPIFLKVLFHRRGF